MSLEWSRVRGTRNWQLVDTEAGQIVRHIAVRDPYINEPDGTKYVVTGPGHPTPDIAGSLSEAQDSAVASLESGVNDA